MKFRPLIGVLIGLAVPGMFWTVRAQERTQWDGVYTTEQAKRGEPVYNDVCSSCHGTDLNGEMAPSLSGSAFTSNWNDQPLGKLFDRIKMTMPATNPGSLSPQQTSDILAFILHAGNFPPGASELTADSEILNTIKFLSKKPGA